MLALRPPFPPAPMDSLRPEPPPRQYAVPAEPFPAKYDRSKSNGLSYSEHEFLRQRKTPHGILLEEDQPAVDKHVQYPASKHVLLSSSPGHHVPKSAYPTYSSQSSQRRVSDGLGYGVGDISYQQQYPPPAWDFPGGLDSVLNQSLPLQATSRFYLQQGSNIPTVLPATIHTNWGPTASASQEYYGPYWPDGTYTPYRPAAVRDNRYYTHRWSGPQYGPATYEQTARLPQLRKPGRLPPLLHDQGQQSTFPPPYQPPSNRTEQWQSYPTAEPSNRSGYNDPYEQSYPSSGQLQGSIQAVPGYHNSRLLLTEPLVRSPQSQTIAFRDKSYTWANRIYTELLINIQRTSREQNGPQSHGHKPIAKPVIFPKPPKRTGSHFSESLLHAPKPSRESSSAKPIPPLIHADTDPARPPTAIFSPSRRASDFGVLSRQKTFTPSASPFPPPFPPKYDSRRTSDSTIYQYHGPQPEYNIKDAAHSALTQMELLCEEAQVLWIDGMLLAGCLAYGLACYDKALHWYQMILTEDRSHVEAMSNLAATLLALNRKDEAMEYWTAVVRLRPSYFEAVEHLIGLLCSSRRAKEAVALIEFVEESLKLRSEEAETDSESDAKSHASSIATTSSVDQAHYDFDFDGQPGQGLLPEEPRPPGYGSSGYAIAGSENGRMLALIHAKGNMLYALNNNSAAASAFEDAILIATGQRKHGIRGLIRKILFACLRNVVDHHDLHVKLESKDPILLAPNQAEFTARNMFPPSGELPGLEFVARGIPSKAAVSTTSNSLLSLAKIYQDAMSSAVQVGTLRSTSTRDVLALYYLSLSLQRSPSTANNVGILLAGVQQSVHVPRLSEAANDQICNVPGVVPGSGISLALLYYNYGLNLDPKHAHLYTNLGSLLKDIGQLAAAIKMYESAVSWDGNFDIALANLANAVKDQGRVADAITYYKRAVQSNAEFAEAVCGLATALNSVCSWHGRGGVYADGGRRDRIHVDERGMLHEASNSYGWLNRVCEIVTKQLKEGETWGTNTLTPTVIQVLVQQLTAHQRTASASHSPELEQSLVQSMQSWLGQKWEGSRIVRLVERAIRRIGWQWYQDRYKHSKEFSRQKYFRPRLPTALSAPSAPTVLPFHTFTTPLSAKHIRQISQRNALRISVSTLRSAWLPDTVFPPPPPPNPALIVGYVSSDFNNHPLAHLMQSIFGLHDRSRVYAICYATTASDNSIHRKQIEREAPLFHDASSWSVERLVKQIVSDGVHILVNLNGYTRGARNEVFAARPAPIHMSFMGFAGTLGAEWCDYVLADEISVPTSTLSPWRRNVDLADRLHPDALVEDAEDWIYSENLIYTKHTFFCVDHKQSGPDVEQRLLLNPSDPTKGLEAWHAEQSRRWKLRRELFPGLSETAIIFGNFNQLYKIDPSTFRTYLRILSAVPNSILWLLRFPDLGEQHLKSYAAEWAGGDVAGRIVFTDVAAKGLHITRASVVDLFLDTPECNAHTTSADVVWSGTPVLTWGRWEYKMCSRMASSIVSSALPEGPAGDRARADLVVKSEEEYERHAISLARSLRYPTFSHQSTQVDFGVKEMGRGEGRLMDLRRMLWEGRWGSRLFDTKRWVRDVERGYWEAWGRWERGEGGDIWLD
jgi:predicted O-linked N-acetylglucosamine transferase (SPINDLY family)